MLFIQAAGNDAQTSYRDTLALTPVTDGTSTRQLHHFGAAESNPVTTLPVTIQPGSAVRVVLQTSQPYPSKNNKRDDLIYNEDGSVDLYFGPTPPTGFEQNWTQTVVGKGWFTILRLYGPLESWFDKTWQPGEVELID